MTSPAVNVGSQEADSKLNERLASDQPTIEKICAALVAQLKKYGFDNKADVLAQPMVNGELRKDPYDGAESLYAEWRSANGDLLGHVMIHDSGQLYAEFDIVAPHPTDKRWFIESITAWGSAEAIKTELQNLAALT
ncbi:hypothetical protein [Aurantivibrio plasticivorans]